MIDTITLVNGLRELGSGWMMNDEFDEWYDYEDSDLGGVQFVKGGVVGIQNVWEHQYDYEVMPKTVSVYKYKAEIGRVDGRIRVYEARRYPGVQDYSDPDNPMWYYHLCTPQEIEQAKRA